MGNSRQGWLLLVVLVMLLSVGIHVDVLAAVFDTELEYESEAESESKTESESDTEQELPLEAHILPEGDSPDDNGYYDGDVIVRAEVTGYYSDQTTGRWRIIYIPAEAADESEGEAEELIVEAAYPYEALDFEGEGIYRVQLTVRDIAGRQCESEEIQFVIDKTAPQARLYCRSNRGVFSLDMNGAGQQSFFLNKADGSVWLSLIISERNFNDESELTALDVFRDGQPVRVNSSWMQQVDGTWQYEWALPGDGCYQIVFQYTDPAGHALPEAVEAEIVYDTHSPEIKFSFDTSDAQNGSYYHNEKVLQITVTDANFDIECRPDIVADNRVGYSFTGWTVKNGTAEGQITFSEDGTYSVLFNCQDTAGNTSAYAQLDTFIIDRARPEIAVVYDNNEAENMNYYRRPRRADVTIAERNFNSNNAVVTVKEAGGGEIPALGTWTAAGDRHTLSLLFEADGAYTLEVACKDLAGNTADGYISEQFIIDRTPPELQISGVADGSSYGEGAAPVLYVFDENAWEGGLRMTLTDTVNGQVDVARMVRRQIHDHGEVLRFQKFALDGDGIYILEAEAEDMAGNQTAKRIAFSVNRSGSIYGMDASTEAMRERVFLNQPGFVTIEEMNLDMLNERELSCKHNGKLSELSDKKDYTLQMSGNGMEMKCYSYVIGPEYFKEEGDYSFYLYSVDRAGNRNTSQGKGVDIQFVFDYTAPVVVVSNLEDGIYYNENVHAFTVNVRDNINLEKVTYYLNGEAERVYEKEELDENQGTFQIGLKEDEDVQNVSFIACDAAGNTTETEIYHVLVKQGATPAEGMANLPAPGKPENEASADSFYNDANMPASAVMAVMVIALTIFILFSAKDKH